MSKSTAAASFLKVHLPSDLGHDSPAQPLVTAAPQSEFGSVRRSFQVAWYSGRPWLEYSVENDACFCYACRIFYQRSNKDETFTLTGFRNWKVALQMSKGFAKHSSSKSHVAAMSHWTEKMKRVTEAKTIEESLCHEQIGRNRYYFTRIIEAVKFLVVNELAFRGDSEDLGSINCGMFLKLMEYSLKIDAKFKEISVNIPNNAKYTSPTFQNEMISILASMVYNNTIEEIKGSPTGLFTIKCDETRDRCGVELLTVVIRFVNSQCCPDEKLLGIVELVRFDATFITEKILDVLKDLDLRYLLAQAYDGAAVMSGKVGGVQIKMCENTGRDIPYVHCFNHQLHLVVVHVCEKVTAVREFFDTVAVLCNFLSKPKVRSIFKDTGATGLAKLMEQRWTGHYKTTKFIIHNYNLSLIHI